MRSPFYWLKPDNRQRQYQSIASVSMRAGIIQAKAALHRKGLLTGEAKQVIDGLLELPAPEHVIPSSRLLTEKQMASLRRESIFRAWK